MRSGRRHHRHPPKALTRESPTQARESPGPDRESPNQNRESNAQDPRVQLRQPASPTPSTRESNAGNPRVQPSERGDSRVWNVGLAGLERGTRGG